MRKHNQEFKEKIKLMGRQLDSKLTFDETELGNEQLNAVTPVLQSSLLKSVMKELDIDSNVDIPIGTIINYKFGVLLDNGDYEYLDFGNYQIYSSEKQEDNNAYNIVAYDKMLNSMVEYTSLKDTSKQFPMTVRDYIGAICNDINITFKDSETEFANFNRLIPSDLYANLGYTYRDILDELAQATASNIIINENDELEIKYITDTEDTIDEEFLKDINVAFGQKYGPINSIVLSRSAGADNIYLRDEQSVTDNGLCEIKISDNQIMNFNDRSDYLPAILEKLNGLEYYINDFTSTGVCYYEVADKYNVKIGENIYNCVMFNDEIDITQGFEEIIHTDMPEQAETDYTKADKTDRKLNQTYLIVDKQNQTIESVVSQVDGYDERFTRVEQSIDELRQEISHAVDLTISGDTLNGTLDINGVGEGEPLEINVRPYIMDLGKTYPRLGIYPGDIMFTQSNNAILRIENIDTKEYSDYEIPDTLHYLDENVYDILNYKYGNNKCTITKNIEFRDGQAYKIDTPVVTEYDFPTINLKVGNYRIYLVGYDYGYIFFKAMIKNDYTDLFATKIELRSAITQTEDKIESEVESATTLFDKKVEDLDSKITQTAESIEQTVTSYKEDTDGRIEDLNTQITQTATDITSQVNQTKTDLEGQIETVSSTVTQTADTLTSEINKKVDTTTFNSRIQQTERSIESKVDEGDFGSLMQQYYNRVIIGFNKNSSVIQLATNGISIYRNNNLRVRLNEYDVSFYQDDYNVGSIGANYYSEDSSQRGLVFDLNGDGSYMGWFQRTGSSGSFTATMYYARAGKFGEANEGIHFSKNVYGHGWYLSGFNMTNSVANEYQTINNKSIPIVTDVLIDESGNLKVTKSSINVRSGLVTAVPTDAKDIS